MFQTCSCSPILYNLPTVVSLDAYERIGVDYPNFMAPSWFKKNNAGALRLYIRHLILMLFHEQAHKPTKPATLPATNSGSVDPEPAPDVPSDPGSGSRINEAAGSGIRKDTAAEAGFGSGKDGVAAGSTDLVKVDGTAVLGSQVSQVDVTNIASLPSQGPSAQVESNVLLEDLLNEVASYNASSR